MKKLDKFHEYLISERFEKIADTICWWGMGIGVLYFVVRIGLSFIFGI